MGKHKRQRSEGLVNTTGDDESLHFKKKSNKNGSIQEKGGRTSEMELLRKRVIDEAPDPGTQPFLEDGEKRRQFNELPISKVTIRGLYAKGFKEMTDIQLAAIPHALAGRDVLGAAKTGSGKTLAFIVPLLEKLYREGWTFSDGLGALVITPTRELALQIFEVLRGIGKGHMFSAALLTGGKKEFREEQIRIPRMNIVVATPGRLLQHLEETPGFDPSQLQLLVLDEADRILDMGFSAQLQAILNFLPPGSAGRQTLLFSATQTKSLKALAGLSLSDAQEPQYVGVHDKAEHATPDKLIQNYVSAALPDKLDVLWSFIKSHLKHKIVVFFSTCSQVRYVYECFRCMQPGVPLLALHGKIKQQRRTYIYFDFVRRPSAVLLATDIAARGLDFPACDWVVQVDAPEDAAMYIHRVGRTARYKAGGRSLLFLLPSEEPGMLKLLSEAHIPIKRLTINPSKTTSVKQKAAGVVAANMECKRLAQKAFTSYLRSVALMPHQDIFNVTLLPTQEFAESLGLINPPSLKFLKLLSSSSSNGQQGDDDAESRREGVREKKNRSRALERLKEKIKAEKAARKGQSKTSPQLSEKTSQQRTTTAAASENEEDDDEEESSSDNEEEGLLTVKRTHDWRNEGEEEEGLSLLLHQKKKKAEKLRISIDKPSGQGKKIVFNDEDKSSSSSSSSDHDDEEEHTGHSEDEKVANDMNKLQEKNEEYVRRVQRRLQANREADRIAERERVREKHTKKRMKEKGAKREEDEEAMFLEGGVVLGNVDKEEEEEEEGGGGGGRGTESSSSEEEEEEDRSRSVTVQEQENAILKRLRGEA